MEKNSIPKLVALVALVAQTHAGHTHGRAERPLRNPSRGGQRPLLISCTPRHCLFCAFFSLTSASLCGPAHHLAASTHCPSGNYTKLGSQPGPATGLNNQEADTRPLETGGPLAANARFVHCKAAD